MLSQAKNQSDILQKLSIEKLNPMQIEAQRVIQSNSEIVLLSPTGTGKTIAFILPILKDLDIKCDEIQVLIIVPSRELAIQIEQVIREMGTGFKTNAVYGGRNGSKDKMEIKHRPAILIGTPGRIADHLRRQNFDTTFIKTLILDEFDKSLEIGFEKEMMEILAELLNVSKKILTSATFGVQIPAFVELQNPVILDYLENAPSNLIMRIVSSPDKDKLNTLLQTLQYVGKESGIVFCNYKDTIQFVSEYLNQHGISHGCFFGGMEQRDRERALIKFRNGTHKILIATDLAARGIDVPELKFIIHFQLPFKEEEFTHRNGRTARMLSKEGTAYILKWEKEKLPDFIEKLNLESQDVQSTSKSQIMDSAWQTLFISGGKTDKISKGDIVGLFMKQGNLEKNDIGSIEIKLDCSFVSVSESKAKNLILKLDNTKLKTKKVRIREI